MPVSRNRKKKYNHNSKHKPKAAKPKCIHELFRLQTNPCKKCRGVRDEFSFKELPDEEQCDWEKAEIKESIDFFLYCASCEEYSAVLELEDL